MIFLTFNLKCTNRIELCHEVIRARLSKAFAEFKGVRTNTSTRHYPPRTVAQWIVTCRGSLKVNVDAIVGKSRSIISVVARDYRGELVFACTKWANTNLPQQAEAEALRWVAFLSTQLPFESICIEGDSKVCIQAISNLNVETPWRIQNIISKIISLANHVNRLSFCWIPRVANRAAYVLAKWSTCNRIIGSFDVSNCPPCLSVVIRVEACSLTVV